MKLNATIANLRLFNSGVYKDVTISFPTTTEKIHSALRKIAIVCPGKAQDKGKQDP